MVEQVIQNIVDWITIAPPLGVYLLFFAIAYLENVVPPVPGDVSVVFGGYLVAEGVISFPILFASTVFASVFGFLTMYWLGYKWGVGIKNNGRSHFILKFIDYKYFRRGQLWMDKWGQWVIVSNRFLAGTRSVIALMAGVTHINLGFTAMNSLISSLLWNFVLIATGWYIKDNWKIVGKYLSTYGELVLILLIIAIVLRYFIKYRALKKRKARKE